MIYFQLIYETHDKKKNILANLKRLEVEEGIGYVLVKSDLKKVSIITTTGMIEPKEFKKYLRR